MNKLGFFVALIFFFVEGIKSPHKTEDVIHVAANPIDLCPTFQSAHIPKDVNDLAPWDFKVVMALGDSISAGFGIKGINGGLDEFRGLSGPIGGDQGAITLPNFIRHYRSDDTVIGPSTGQHIVELPQTVYHPNDHCNGAQSDAVATDLMYQIEHIVKQLTNNSQVDMENDWKFMNILIGANDACPLCKRSFDKPTPQEAADAYEQSLRETIQAVYEKIPRTFVNILPLFNLSGVYDLSLGKDYCKYFHDIVPVECPCAFDSTDKNREYLDEVVTEYRARVVKISDDWRAMNLTDFTVVYQPFTMNLEISDLPIEFLSTLDCFHPSLIAHQTIAIAAWNSLLLPFAEKPTNFDPTESITCATPDARFWTS